jgi:hypothetical protein
LARTKTPGAGAVQDALTRIFALVPSSKNSGLGWMSRSDVFANPFFLAKFFPVQNLSSLWFGLSGA